MSERKKEQGSLIAGFGLGAVTMAIGVFVATRFVGGSLFGESSTRDKAIALLAVLAPLFFVGQRALSAGSAGRVGEARGLFLGLVSGAMIGLFLAFGIGMKSAGL